MNQVDGGVRKGSCRAANPIMSRLLRGRRRRSDIVLAETAAHFAFGASNRVPHADFEDVKVILGKVQLRVNNSRHFIRKNPNRRFGIKLESKILYKLFIFPLFNFLLTIMSTG